jgi:hypothetical protein
MSVGKSQSDLVKTAREINRIHHEIVENSQAQLTRAIECGVMLKGVQDSLEHGEWKDWLAKSCPDIPDRTARLYMQLAKNADKLEQLVADNGNSVADLSIRGAVRLLKPQPTEEEKAKAEAEAAEKKATAKAAMKKQDLADVLEDKAPDELLLAIGDKEKKDELLKQQLKYQSPLILADVLVEVWEVEQLQQLVEEITALAKRKLASTEHRVGSQQAIGLQ